MAKIRRAGSKKTGINSKLNMKVVIPVVFLIILALIFVAMYCLRDRNSVSDCAVLYGSASDESVEYLKSECRSRTNSTLFKYNGLTSRLLDNVIIMTNDIMTVPDMGIAAQGLGSNDILIYHWGNNIYIYTADDSTMKVAINYFVNKCLDAEGHILISEGEVQFVSGQERYEQVYIEDAPIEIFSVYYDKKAMKEAAELLQYYVAQSCGVVCEVRSGKRTEVAVTDGSGKAADFLLVYSNTMESGQYSIALQNNDVVITAHDNETMEQAVCMFANRYLGWYYAGTEKEHFSNHSDSVHIEIALEESSAWIGEREPIITLWNVNYPRGFYLSTDVSLETDIMSFSDDQLYDYVRMMQYCGYTGIQVTDMCSSWAGAGGYESVQEKIRVMFDAAHCLGMNTTLWVWGAEFDGYGWTDTNVTIERTDENVRNNPEAYAVFNEYYDKYAELADCTDRLIAHYYDPGNLTDSEDIAFYAKLLWSKFSAVNPDVKFGINCWGDKFNKAILCRELGSGFTIYEGTIRNEESGYEEFRTFVNEHGNELGTWSWNNCEMEIDQLAQMNYNIEIIKSTYLNARNYDSLCKPAYWSEMDSNHLVNVFSLYSAARLLQNPDLDTYELTGEIAKAAVGPEYESEMADILLLIQRARSGENWDTYFWSSEDYILLSDEYPAGELLQDSEKALADLDEMINAGVESYAIPVPISMTDLLSLVRPQVQQIHDYAVFRIAMDDLEEYCEKNAEELKAEVAELRAQDDAGNETDDNADASDNAKAEGSVIEDSSVISDEAANPESNTEVAPIYSYVLDKITAIGEPIKEYNTVIGSWGQIEARAQQILVGEFCEKYGIERPHYAQYDAMWKYRIRSQFASYQRGCTEPVLFRAPYYQYGFALGADEQERLVTEMVEDGLLLRKSDGSVYLADWDNYIYMISY